MHAFFTLITLQVLALWLAGGSWAACPTVPDGWVEPLPQRIQVDLQRELDQPWQAGGAIMLVCGPGGKPMAGRMNLPPANAEEERARRVEHFEVARRLNFARKGEVNTRNLALPPDRIAFIERFALSDSGAVWLREVADDTLRLFNKGYLDYDRALWRRAMKRGHLPKLSQLLTGRLTETGQFAEDAQVFKFAAYAGSGAMAQPGAIGLGDAGLKCQFPSSNELVDPHAILSHEFGHTRYGDPDSAGSLLGEARTVERYENPVRQRNGYAPRALYFERTSQGKLEPSQGSLLDRLKVLEREKGISIADQRSIDRYHCDCPGPLPVILDCEVRQRPGNDGINDPAYRHDCKLNWKPEPWTTDVLQGVREFLPAKE